MSETRNFIEFISDPGDLHALVMLNGKIGKSSTGRVAIGFYQDLDRFCSDAALLNECGNLYTNLNRLNPDIYGRAADRVQTWSPTRFVDSEVVRRRLILIDADPKRVSGINSTDEELQAAIDVVDRIEAYLFERWKVKPLKLISGNGAQLLYLINEPADTPLVGQVLVHLHGRFSTDKVTIDTGVSDAARITRLAGTLNMKGDDVSGRPRRYARIQSIPDERATVTTEQLEILCAPITGVSTSPRVNIANRQSPITFAPGDWTHEKLRNFLDNEFKGTYRQVTDCNKGYDNDCAYDLQACPFNDHGDEKWKSRISLNNGHPGFKCFHNSCSSPKRTFYDFLQLFSVAPELAVTDELRLAKNVVSEFSQNGTPTLRYFRGDWFWWDGCWQKFDDEAFVSHVYKACKNFILEHWPKGATGKNGKPQTAPPFGTAAVNNVTLALKSLVTIQDIGWIDGRGGRWIAFRDRLLDLNSWVAGSVVCVPQTPEYFAPTALRYDLSFTEDEPTIFLEKLAEQVSASEVDVLQEFGGYCLTEETAIQRILYMVGPPRSFKGTFERVVRATIGDHNAVSKTFASFLGAHALQNVPGKTFLGISDSRPDPKLSRQAVERLLSISGEDAQDINPKGKSPFTVKLVCKIGIASNIMADFADPTGALLSRFLFVETTKSFAANPDPTLLDRILTQQNEITWWFLRGLRRLEQKGCYTEPQNGLQERFKIQSNPIPCFIDSNFAVTGKTVHKMARDTLFDGFESWCVDKQIACPEKNVFFRDLYMIYSNVKAHDRNISGIMALSA
jgi:hypothetical protein